MLDGLSTQSALIMEYTIQLYIYESTRSFIYTVSNDSALLDNAIAVSRIRISYLQITVCGVLQEQEYYFSSLEYYAYHDYKGVTVNIYLSDRSYNHTTCVKQTVRQHLLQNECVSECVCVSKVIAIMNRTFYRSSFCPTYLYLECSVNLIGFISSS